MSQVYQDRLEIMKSCWKVSLNTQLLPPSSLLIVYANLTAFIENADSNYTTVFAGEWLPLGKSPLNNADSSSDSYHVVLILV